MEMFREAWFLPLAVLLAFCLFACEPNGDDDQADDDADDDDDNNSDDDNDFPPDDDDDNDNDADDDDDDNDYAPPPSNDIGVFVSLGTGGYGNSGTMEEPLRYIEDGLALAESELKVVFVAAALYNEAFTAFVSMYGGYDPLTWTRDIAANRTILSPHSPTAD
jgi:hypothetical protein